MFGLNMIANSLSSLMVKLITNTACPFVKSQLILNAEFVEIIGVGYVL